VLFASLDKPMDLLQFSARRIQGFWRRSWSTPKLLERAVQLGMVSKRMLDFDLEELVKMYNGRAGLALALALARLHAVAARRHKIRLARPRPEHVLLAYSIKHFWAHAVYDDDAPEAVEFKRVACEFLLCLESIEQFVLNTFPKSPGFGAPKQLTREFLSLLPGFALAASAWKRQNQRALAFRHRNALLGLYTALEDFPGHMGPEMRQKTVDQIQRVRERFVGLDRRGLAQLDADAPPPDLNPPSEALAVELTGRTTIWTPRPQQAPFLSNEEVVVELLHRPDFRFDKGADNADPLQSRLFVRRGPTFWKMVGEEIAYGKRRTLAEFIGVECRIMFARDVPSAAATLTTFRQILALPLPLNPSTFREIAEGYRRLTPRLDQPRWAAAQEEGTVVAFARYIYQLVIDVIVDAANRRLDALKASGKLTPAYARELFEKRVPAAPVTEAWLRGVERQARFGSTVVAALVKFMDEGGTLPETLQLDYHRINLLRREKVHFADKRCNDYIVFRLTGQQGNPPSPELEAFVKKTQHFFAVHMSIHEGAYKRVLAK
jgi:hypothetical protein